MQTARVVIVGGGLSGLYAAYLLQQRGFRDHVLLEAREVLGGRIVSVPASVPGSVLDATAEAAIVNADLKLIRLSGSCRFKTDTPLSH